MIIDGADRCPAEMLSDRAASRVVPARSLLISRLQLLRAQSTYTCEPSRRQME